MNLSQREEKKEEKWVGERKGYLMGNCLQSKRNAGRKAMQKRTKGQKKERLKVRWKRRQQQ